jgi:RluA family pseudouridine synthase
MVRKVGPGNESREAAATRTAKAFFRKIIRLRRKFADTIVSDVIKLSAKETRGFWEISVLFEDEHLLALNKPAQLPTSPDRFDPTQPSLISLLHRDIERGATWAKHRPALTYLMNAHRLDSDTTGILLFAKNKSALIALANQFGSEKPFKTYVALVRGAMQQDTFDVNAKISPHPTKLGFMRIDERNGKRSRTDFTVRERFKGFSLLECRPLTARTHQIRVHLQYLGLPILGDSTYGGSQLLLSSLKKDYHLKPKKVERPLISTLALHAEKLVLSHPVTGNEISIEAPWPKDLKVAVKYLRLHATP